MGYEYYHNMTVLDTHIAIFSILMIRVAFLTQREMRDIEKGARAVKQKCRSSRTKKKERKEEDGGNIISSTIALSSTGASGFSVTEYECIQCPVRRRR